MADIDPKDVLLKNKVLVGLYAMAILPIVLWFVLVGGGAKADFQKEARKLKKDEKKIKKMLKSTKGDESERPLTTKHIEAFKARHDAYSQQLASLNKLVYERDKALEKWFDDPLTNSLKPGEEPKANDYISLYREKIEALIQDYSDMVVPEGGGAPRVYRQEPPRNMLKPWQKRFWIQKYALDALREGTKGGTPAKMSKPIQFSEPGDLAPGQVVQRLGASIDFTCQFSSLPKVVERLLAQPISFQVLSMKITKEAFLYDDRDISLRVDGRDTTFNEPYYTGELKDHSAFKGEDKIDEYLPEPAVRVALELEVLDFEVKPPAPPPAPEAPPEDEGAGEGEGEGEGEGDDSESEGD